MKTNAAVLTQMERPQPYAQSVPLEIEELDLTGPGPREVLVELSAAGLCHSDLSVINGTRPWPLPIVLGHEAAGVVREVGDGVDDLKSGDHVVFSYVPVCGRCSMCVSGRGNLCERGRAANVAGTLLSGARRFQRKNGTLLHHHLGVSGFSQYTVAARESLVRVEKDIPLEIAVLFGCAVMTGVGAVVNTAKVTPGTPVAVFGLGGVGLSAVMGARAAGAWPIIAVDTVDSKLELAKCCGASHTIAAKKSDPVAAIKDLTQGGAETTFEAVGHAQVLAQSYAATRRGGKTVAIGIPHPNQQLSIQAVSIPAEERQLLGSYMGSCVPQRDVPRFMNLYRAGMLPVDLLKSREIKLDEVNVGFDALDRGEVARQVIRFHS
jgi:alcohol dehydrogenase